MSANQSITPCYRPPQLVKKVEVCDIDTAAILPTACSPAQQRSDSRESVSMLPLQSGQSARVVFVMNEHIFVAENRLSRGEKRQGMPSTCVHRIGAHSAFALRTTKDCNMSVSPKLIFVCVRRPRMRVWVAHSLAWERASDVYVELVTAVLVK